MKTLYVADLDGTLLTSSGELTKKSEVIINSLISHGLNFTVNTSRTPESAEKYLSRLALKLPAIMMNGSAFFDKASGCLTDFYPLERSVARAAISAALKAKCEPFLFGYEDKKITVTYSSAEKELSKKFISDRISYYEGGFVSEKYPNPNKPTLYIVCLGYRPELLRLKGEIERIKGCEASLFMTGETSGYLEIYSENAGKWRGVERLKESLGFDRTVCFGDNLNDIEMLKRADLGIATANGYLEAKSAADLTIGSCDCDSVAEYLMIEWSRKG